MLFQDIAKLDDLEQTLTADVYIVLRWLDPRLADPNRGKESADCPVPEGKLWVPLIEPENLHSREQFYNKRFLVNARGVATLVQRQYDQVSNPLDFRRFPFDRHAFRISLWPAISRIDEVVFHPLKEYLTVNDKLTIQGWEVGRPVASVTEVERPGRIGVFSRYDVVVDLRRDYQYYLWKMGIPLALIVVMAYTVYFIPPKHSQEQIGVGMTAVLTLVAYMFALGTGIPRIAYLTIADRIFIGSAILVFFGLVKAIMTTVWARPEHRPKLARFDLLGRWLYPAGVLIVILGPFLV